MDQPSVSIVISTFNRAATLERTILSLRYLRYPKFEVIVVNGPSSDNTADILSRNADFVQAIACKERNLSISRNLGIRASSGDVIAFIDDDAIPEPDWLDQLVKGFAFENVASVGGFIRNNTGVQFQARYTVADLWGQARGYETFEQAQCEESPDTEAYFSLTGTNSSFLRSALVKVGLFDEVFEYFLDETDLNLRLVKSGYQSFIVSSAEIHHKYAASHLRDQRNVPRNMEPICRSIAYFAMKHALNRYGWDAVRARLEAFERNEINWKLDNLRHGDVDREHFTSLVMQIRSGIRQGINLGSEAEFSKPELSSSASDTAPKYSRPLMLPQNRLRVCMFSQDEASETPGGIGRWTKYVASGLADRGHEVTVMGRSQLNAHTVDFQAEGYWRHLIVPQPAFYPEQFGAQGLPESLACYTRTLRLEVERVAERRRFDLVSGPIWDVEIASMLEAHTPACVSLHTTAALALESKPEWRNNKDYFTNHVQKVIAAEKAAILKADIVLANSEAIVNDCERIYSIKRDGRFHVVPHGIPDVPEQHRYIGLTRDRRTVKLLFVGRLETRTGLDVLAPAIDNLLSEFDFVSIDFVGSGVEDTHIQAVQNLQWKYPGRAIHHGFVEENQLASFYLDADIFVAPSKYESFGLIFAEAMRYSIPCVGTMAGGIIEVVENRQTGLLSEIEDAESLYRNLKLLVQAPEIRKEFGVQGRQRFEKLFTINSMISGLEEVFVDLKSKKERAN